MENPTDGNRKNLRERRAAVAAARRARQLAAMLDDPLAAAPLPRDVLLPALRVFSKAGLELDLECTAPGMPSWTPALGQWAFELTRRNMRKLYEAAAVQDRQWRWRDADKRAEMLHADSRFIVARVRRAPAALPLPEEAPDAAAAAAARAVAEAEGVSSEAGACTAPTPLLPLPPMSGRPVAFLSFRFVMEEALDVLYVYELQLDESVQRRGLGRALMSAAELAARRCGMQAVMLTVLKGNAAALDFYMTKMKYSVDPDSPSACGDDSAGHEILCKVVDRKGFEAAQQLIADGLV